MEEVTEPRICKNCNNQFHGLYCNLCGEKVILPKDRKLSNVVGSILAITSIVDNKFFKSLKLIVTNPGFLSREYADGRRVRYMRPLQLFFILNLIQDAALCFAPRKDRPNRCKSLGNKRKHAADEHGVDL